MSYASMAKSSCLVTFMANFTTFVKFCTVNALATQKRSFCSLGTMLIAGSTGLRSLHYFLRLKYATHNKYSCCAVIMRRVNALRISTSGSKCSLSSMKRHTITWWKLFRRYLSPRSSMVSTYVFMEACHRDYRPLSKSTKRLIGGWSLAMWTASSMTCSGLTRCRIA